jgi:AraC-like DNA-binding protein
LALTFSTADVHPRDRLAYWRETVTVRFPKLELKSGVGPAFEAGARIHQLADLIVTEFECDPCEAVRDRRHIAQCTSDQVVLCLQTAGRTVLNQDGRQAVLEAGSLAIWDMLRPGIVTTTSPVGALTVSIPRRALEARLGSLVPLAAHRLDATTPLVGLAFQFLQLLPAHIETLDQASAASVAEKALDLIALAFSHELRHRLVALSSSRSIALMRLKSCIEPLISDPSLKPPDVAAAAGMSVRYANGLLSLEGTSIERYIWSRRLERCRLALRDPMQMNRTVGDIAFGWGFSDLSHFARRFKAAFGLSPSDYRRLKD